jgi:hypothetical protein
MRITDEQVAAMQARVDAASKGPWRSDHANPRIPGEVVLDRVANAPTEIATTYDGERGLVAQAWVGPTDDRQPHLANAAFIAHARTDMPALLSERAEMVEAFRQIIARGHSHTCSFESAMALTCDCAVGIAERMLNGGAK